MIAAVNIVVSRYGVGNTSLRANYTLHVIGNKGTFLYNLEGSYLGVDIDHDPCAAGPEN